jgi:hypothetical protein
MKIKSLIIFLWGAVSPSVPITKSHLKISHKIQPKKMLLKKKLLKKNLNIKKKNSLLDNIIEKKPKETVYLINDYNSTDQWTPSTSMDEPVSMDSSETIDGSTILSYINQKAINPTEQTINMGKKTITGEKSSSDNGKPSLTMVESNPLAQENHGPTAGVITETFSSPVDAVNNSHGVVLGSQDKNHEQEDIMITKGSSSIIDDLNNSDAVALGSKKKSDTPPSSLKKNNEDGGQNSDNNEDPSQEFHSSSLQQTTSHNSNKHITPSTKLEKESSKKTEKKSKNLKKKEDNDNIIFLNINDLAGGLTLFLEEKAKENIQKLQMTPSLKINGDVVWKFWKINFEVPLALEKKNDSGVMVPTTNFFQLNSQINFNKTLAPDLIFLFSAPLTNGGSKIDQSIEGPLNEKDFGENSKWTKGKCFLMGFNIKQNLQVETGWFHNCDILHKSKEKQNNTTVYENIKKNHQFIQLKGHWKKIIVGSMINFATFEELYNLNGFLQYEIFKSGNLAKNPIVIKTFLLTKNVFKGEDITKKTALHYLKSDEKGSNYTVNLTVEIKKISINNESINLKIGGDIKIETKENSWSKEWDWNITVEWRVFKMKFTLKEIKLDFKEITPKYQLKINPNKLRFLEY